MSLFGMINWSYLWFRPGGPIARAAHANLVTQIMIDGIARLGTDSPTRIRLRSKVKHGLRQQGKVQARFEHVQPEIEQAPDLIPTLPLQMHCSPGSAER